MIYLYTYVLLWELQFLVLRAKPGSIKHLIRRWHGPCGVQVPIWLHKAKKLDCSMLTLPQSGHPDGLVITAELEQKLQFPAHFSRPQHRSNSAWTPVLSWVPEMWAHHPSLTHLYDRVVLHRHVVRRHVGASLGHPHPSPQKARLFSPKRTIPNWEMKRPPFEARLWVVGSPKEGSFLAFTSRRSAGSRASTFPTANVGLEGISVGTSSTLVMSTATGRTSIWYP